MEHIEERRVSVEEKARAYDEAIGKLRGMMPNWKRLSYNGKTFLQDLIHIFPELKESGDERIRKALINGFKDYKGWDEEWFDGITVREAIAWLEKQGKNNMGISEATKQELEDNLNKTLEKETPESLNEFLDEQDEQKPDTDFSDLRTWKYIVDAVWTEKEGIGQNLDSPFTEEVAKKLQKRFGNIEQILANSAKTCKDEQKPNSCDGCVNRKGCINCEEENMKETLDKVEPNFHEGDWVVWDNKISCHIDNIYHGKESLMYTITDAHNMIRSYSVKGFDNNAHLWTIQDAKGGDVLACESGWTCIFKSLNDDNTFSSYCFMDKTKWFCETGSKYHTHSKEFMKAYNGEIKPATKEQRDTLEKAMADAGYTFDFEEKVLKKIEQKPAENKGMNLVEEEMTPFQKKVFCIIDTSVEEEQGLKQVCEELLALAANEIEQKPDDLKTKAGNWYVCDMEVMNENMVTAFRRGEIYYCPKDGYLDVRGALFEVGCLDVFRLATEKEIPQTKQEWSEEDENRFTNLIFLVKCSKENDATKEGFIKFINRVKSLRDRVQPKQEWSKEDDYNYGIIQYILNNECVGRADKEIAINWFKSLKERYTWKPSGEQMKAIGHICDGNYNVDLDILDSIYRDFKKLREE